MIFIDDINVFFKKKMNKLIEEQHKLLDNEKIENIRKFNAESLYSELLDEILNDIHLDLNGFFKIHNLKYVKNSLLEKVLSLEKENLKVTVNLEQAIIIDKKFKLKKLLDAKDDKKYIYIDDNDFLELKECIYLYLNVKIKYEIKEIDEAEFKHEFEKIKDKIIYLLGDDFS